MANSTNRRGFLGALGALAGAVPLALAPTAKASPPAKSTPLRPETSDDLLSRRQQQPHDPDDARYDMCDCMDCCRKRRDTYEHPLVLTALLSTRAAVVALRRVWREHCRDNACSTCLDADAFAYTAETLITSLEGEVGSPDDFDSRMKRASIPDASLNCHLAAVVAVIGLQDALLDLTAGHNCGDPHECYPCDLADSVAYHANLATELLRNGGDALPSMSDLLVIARRELLSAERKVTRLRQVKRSGRALPPHSAKLHYGARRSVVSSQEYVDMLTRLAQRDDG
jgi:hypothetical protein